MDSYDGQLYKGQDETRRLLALVDQAVRDNDALLVLACAGELIDRVGDAYFFHDGGRSAQTEVSEFLRELRHEHAGPEREQAIGQRLGDALAGS